MVVTSAARLAASGYLVLASHPWLSGKLAQVAKQLGIVIPADAIVLRIPPPWAKTRDYLKAASTAQLRAMYTFGEVSAMTAGKPLYERLMFIRQQLKGKQYGRMPKYRAPALGEVKRELERRGPLVERAAPMAREMVAEVRA